MYFTRRCRQGYHFLLAIILFATIGTSQASAQVMTVDDLKKLIASGQNGEALATSYVQGLVDGFVAMEQMRRKGLVREKEFCGIIDRYNNGSGGVRHPAYNTKQIVNAWEHAKQPMSTIAPDMVLSYLSGQYGCD